MFVSASQRLINVRNTNFGIVSTRDSLLWWEIRKSDQIIDFGQNRDIWLDYRRLKLAEIHIVGHKLWYFTENLN